MYCGFIRTFGGDEGDRTLDLTDANRTLSQLSYAPRYEIVVGIELNRPGSQLSYAPMTRPLYHKFIFCKEKKWD